MKSVERLPYTETLQGLAGSQTSTLRKQTERPFGCLNPSSMYYIVESQWHASLGNAGPLFHSLYPSEGYNCPSGMQPDDC